VSDVEKLLPPPLPPRRQLPWRALTALFIPAAALAAGTGLAHAFEAPAGFDSSLHWLALSSAMGLLIGLAAGAALKRKALWAAYGLIAPPAVVAAVIGSISAARPVREWMADRREASCHAAGRAVCTIGEFIARCEQGQASTARARELLGEPKNAACTGQRCTLKWLYTGPFRPEQMAGPGGVACFVLTDEQGRGVRHWVMAAD
jgi:hypothetical protein